MPSENERSRQLEACLGFWELGMTEEAFEEISELPVDSQQHPEVVNIRLMILMELHRWPEALKDAETLCRAQALESDPWIKMAFCLHELNRTNEAKEKLLSGPPSLRETGIFYYNLACYECQLGHVPEAWLLLERAVQLDPMFKKLAEEDRDLQPLWPKQPEE